MKYLVFGGSGFIGSHIVRTIKGQTPEAVVYNLDIVESNHDGLSVYIHCDVRKTIALDAVDVSSDDVIINLAAIHRTPGHPDFAYYETNIRGAENVCAFAAAKDVRRVVFTSSIAPYAASEEEKFEDMMPTPNTPYGVSKLVAEHIHKGWQTGDANRELTILRPGVVFGFGENGNFTRLYWSLRKHRFAYPGRRDTIKACMYVKDLAYFILYKLDNHGKGTELYNCTYEPAYTIGCIVKQMKISTGIKTFVPLVPTWILMPAAYIAKALGSPMGICPARVRKLMISTNICGEKMAKSGYKLRYTFDEALRDWLQDSGGKGLK